MRNPTAKKLTSEQVRKKLIVDEQILTKKGLIKFHFGSVDIVVKQKDVVGNLMQEWLQGWFDNNNILYNTNANTQMPPDFFLDPQDHKKGLLEVKAFNRKANPGFDIADFRAYVEELLNEPWMLEVDYLIFGYDMSDNGDVTIKNVWLKKVWEITRSMEKWPLNLQIKQNVVHKIRPGVWYSTAKTHYPIFECREDFLAALEQSIWQNDKTRPMSGTWLVEFKKNWKKHFGTELEIPRWDAIKGKYQLRK